MEAAESTTRYLAVKNDPVQPVNISTTELVIKEEFLTPNSADEDDKCSLNHYYCSNGDPDNLLCRDESSESEGSEEDPGPINDIEIDDSEEYLYKILEIDNPTHNLKISKVWSISENSGNAGTSIAMNFIKNIDAEPKNFQQPESSTKRTAKSEKTKFFTPEKLTMDVDVESSINSSGDELVIDESGIDSEEDEDLKMKPTLLNKSPSKMVQIVHPRIHYSPKSSKVASVLTPDASTNYADFGKSKNLHTTNLKLQRGEDELFKELSQSVGEPHETLIKQTESFLNKVKTVEPPNNEKSQSSDFNEQEKKFLEESDQQLADIFGLSDNLFSDEEDFIEKADNLVKVEENKDIVPIKNKIEKDAIQKHKEPAKRNLNEPEEKKTFEKSPKPKKSFEKSPKPTKSSHSSKIVDSSHKRENSYKKLSDYPDKGQQLLNKQIEEQKLKLKQFKKMENRNGVDLVTELRLNKQLKSKK